MPVLKSQKTISAKEALSLAMQYCSGEERCIYDVSKKLEPFQLSCADKETIIETLVNDKFIDENRYAKAFVHDKYRFNKWGKFKISFALKQKQIPENIIQDALDSILEEPYNEVLKRELEKKLHAFPPTLSEYEKRGRLYRFAAGRGFESDEINKMLNIILNEE